MLHFTLESTVSMQRRNNIAPNAEDALTQLEKQSVAPKVEVLWVDVHSGETHERDLKTPFGDQVPSDLGPIAVSWMPLTVLSEPPVGM